MFTGSSSNHVEAKKVSRLIDIMNQSCFYNTISIRLQAYRITLSTIYSCVAVITVVANALVFYTIWRTSSLHRPSFVLVANLALTDSLVGAIGEPAMIITHVAALNSWTDLFCYSWISSRVISYWLGSISLFTLTAMGVDRLLAVILMDKYQERITIKRIIRVLSSFWLFSGLLMILASFPITKVVIFVAIFISALLVVLVASYVLAFLKLRKLSFNVFPVSAQQKKQGETLFQILKYRRSLSTMLIVTMTIILFFVPLLVCAITTSLIYKTQPNYAQTGLLNVTYKLMTSGELIAFANSAINPFVYMWRMRELQAALRNQIRKLFQRHSKN